MNSCFELSRFFLNRVESELLSVLLHWFIFNLILNQCVSSVRYLPIMFDGLVGLVFVYTMLKLVRNPCSARSPTYMYVRACGEVVLELSLKQFRFRFCQPLKTVDHYELAFSIWCVWIGCSREENSAYLCTFLGFRQLVPRSLRPMLSRQGGLPPRWRFPVKHFLP